MTSTQNDSHKYVFTQPSLNFSDDLDIKASVSNCIQLKIQALIFVNLC